MTEEAIPKEQEEQQFVIQRIYLKDMSFESPNSPAIYAEEWDPDISLQMNTQARAVGAPFFEVELDLTVTVKSKEQTAFLVEVKQAGVFQITGYDADEMNNLLASYCPTILFPYAREAISSLVSKGSFPELHLSPINFEALYAQRLEELKQEELAATEES